jgi:DNA-binding NarL/FixJ family response regulator
LTNQSCTLKVGPDHFRGRRGKLPVQHQGLRRDTRRYTGILLSEDAVVVTSQGIQSEAIQIVAQGKPFFSPKITETLLEEYMRHLQQRGLQDSYELLTDREREVLQVLAEGRSNKEVATLLNLSVYTVETHRTNLMQKLNLHNTAELVLYSVRKKIIS